MQERGRKPVSALVKFAISESIFAAYNADLDAKEFRRVLFQTDGC
jgi:hypothetical protein